ncbi:MAG: hypothetical protein QME52_00025 [Bacteroidota bacterium]|nr:hypothetical protein [Bacteroidota bacterium]
MTIEYLEHKLVRRPFSPLFARLVHEYLMAGKNQEAKKLCISGLEIYPQYITAHFALAECYVKDQDYTAALESIDYAISLNPNTTTLISLRSEIQDFIDSEQTPDSLNTNLQIEDNLSAQQLIEYPSVEEYDSTNTEEPIVLCPAIEIEQSKILEETNLSLEIGHESACTEENLIAVPTIETEIPIESTDKNEIIQAVADIPSTQETFIANNESDKLELIEAKTEIEQPVSSDEDTIEISENQEHDVDSQTENQIADNDVYIEPVILKTDEDDGRIVSGTLAEIYASQGEYIEAILTYRLLKQNRPELGEEIEKRILELEGNIQGELSQNQN